MLLYAAVMVCEPTVVNVVVWLACPLAFTGTVSSRVLPSKNVTPSPPVASAGQVDRGRQLHLSADLGGLGSGRHRGARRYGPGGRVLSGRDEPALRDQLLAGGRDRYGVGAAVACSAVSLQDVESVALEQGGDHFPGPVTT
ncbi:hypothetical protein AB0G82_27905 [Streptomyces anulatus]|uniref:hypothetical protein n=1 Tax=Streptomyces anulatus TaxID=1892 RepID=UPI0033E696AC